MAVVCSALLLTAGMCPASAGTWARVYGGSGNDEALAVQQTSDGGFVLAGLTQSSGAGSSDAWVLKLDGSGNVQWERTYGGTGNDDAQSIHQTSDGGYVFAGRTDSFGQGGPGDFWVVKLSSTGGIQWEMTYGGACIEDAHAVQQTSDGGYVVAGNTCSFGFVGSGDVWVVKLDSSGNIVWESTYGFASTFETATSIQELSGGGYIVAGYTDVNNPPMNPPPADNDFWFFMLDASGFIQWQWTAGGFVSGLSGDSAHAVQQTSDGGFVVVGTTTLGAGSFDFWVIKLSGAGMIQWQQTYGFPLTLESAQSVRQTADGGYVVAGYRRFGGSLDLLVIKLDASGNMQWQKSYNAGTRNLANAVRQTSDGGYVVAGFTDALSSGNKDAWVLRLDAGGGLASGCGFVGGVSGSLAASGVGARVTNAFLFTPSMMVITGNTGVTAPSSSSAVTQQCPADVRVNQDVGADQQHQVGLALDPNNSSRQVAVYMDDPDPNTYAGVGNPSLGVSFSTDGGATWSDRQVRFGCDGNDDDFDARVDEETRCDGLDDDFDGRIDEDTCCALRHLDPSVAADASGNFYIAFAAEEPGAGFPNFAGSSFVVAARSTDGGNTWSTLPVVASSPYGPDINPPDGMADPAPHLEKPWLAVDWHTISPMVGAAYVGWHRETPFSPTSTDVFVSALAPGAGAWSTPAQVNDRPSDCSDGVMPVVAVDGSVWASWRRNASICGPPARFFVDISLNGGLSFNGFGGDLPGPVYTQIPGTLRGHSFRTLDFPALAVDPHNSVVLMAVFAVDPPGPDEADIMFTKSFNGGNMWLTPVRVNDDFATVTPQYMPAITVKSNANAWTLVDVSWYDERSSIGCNGLDDDADTRIDEELPDGIDNDGDTRIDEDICETRIDVFTARTTDIPNFGTTFSPNMRVTNRSFRPPPSPYPGFLGDYLALASDPNTTFAAWADTRNGHNDIYAGAVMDMDSDGDGELDYTDCNPANPTVARRPGVVQNLQLNPVSMSTNTTLTWTSQDSVAGVATVYDIVTGLLSVLTTDGDYRNSSCLVDDQADTPYTDTRGNPPPGDAYYYLPRAVNQCGSGTYGPTSPTDPRIGLEDGFASLPNPDPCP